MPAIDTAAIRLCYDAALLVERGLTRPTKAVQQASSTSGMTYGSALDYFYNVRRLLNGRSYTRTMNPEGTALILGWIKQDFGAARAQKAAEGVLAHVTYYAALPKGGPQVAVRDVALSVLAASTLDTLLADEASQIAAAIARSPADRQARLAAAPTQPLSITVTARVFQRNADVVAEVLFRANGICESCHKPAPFQRLSNGSPYLEVHHSLPLAMGGPDTVANAKALCPNCHREAHHGQDRARFLPTP